MFSLLFLWIGALIRLFGSRGNLVLENAVSLTAVQKSRCGKQGLAEGPMRVHLLERRIWPAKEALTAPGLLPHCRRYVRSMSGTDRTSTFVLNAR